MCIEGEEYESEREKGGERGKETGCEIVKGMYGNGGMGEWGRCEGVETWINRVLTQLDHSHWTIYNKCPSTLLVWSI